MGPIEVWTIVAVILHFCGVSSFGEWPVIARPWHWSCLCLEMWEIMLIFAFFPLYSFLKMKDRKNDYIARCHRDIEKLKNCGLSEQAEMLQRELDKEKK